MRKWLGRLPRKHDPRVPHFSALTSGLSLPAPLPAVDWSKGLPSCLGMMDNDQLGDCTCAALGHALQVWSVATSGKIDTVPDVDILKLYEEACGYVEGDPSTDQGGVEQDVLTYALNTGIPYGDNGMERHKLAAFVEVDQRVIDDVKLAIQFGGLIYIGFDVPSYMPMQPGTTWDVQPGQGQPQIVGGHAVVCVGYDADGLTVVSWGALYRMTWAFWAEFVDEAYMLADADWFATTGLSPPGLTLAQLEAQMSALQEPAQQAA